MQRTREADVRLLNVAAPQAGQFPAKPCVFVASALTREAYLALVNDREPVDSPRSLLLVGVVATEIPRAPRGLLRIPEPKDRRLKAVTSLLHANPANSATLAELGRHTGASERTLSRLFGREFSMGFHQWRTLLRIQRALRAFDQGASVTETALELGWAGRIPAASSTRSRKWWAKRLAATAQPMKCTADCVMAG